MAITSFTLESLVASLRYSIAGGATFTPWSTSGQQVSQALKTAFGTGAGKCNKLHLAEHSIPLNSNEDLNLFDGSLLDPDGGSLVFNKVKIVLVLLKASPAVAKITLGGNGTTPFLFGMAGTTPSIDVGNGPDGGNFLVTRLDATGFPVSTTLKIMRFNNADLALAASYTLLLAGEG
jgi:hypothetical protein